MIVRKISNIGATRCHILRLKCTKFDFRWGSAPDLAGGAYSAPQTPYPEGSTSKGREREGGGRQGRETRGREEEELRWRVVLTPIGTLDPAVEAEGDGKEMGKDGIGRWG